MLLCSVNVDLKLQYQKKKIVLRLTTPILFMTALKLSSSNLVSSRLSLLRLHNKITYNSCHKQQTIISHSPGGCKPRSKVPPWLGSGWRPSSWFIDGYLLIISSHCKERERASFLPLVKRTQIPPWGLLPLDLTILTVLTLPVFHAKLQILCWMNYFRYPSLPRSLILPEFHMHCWYF